MTDIIQGLRWNPFRNSFGFSVAPSQACTKLSLLSEISKMFDPFRFPNPIASWYSLPEALDDSRWDVDIPQIISYSWHRFRFELYLLTSLSILTIVFLRNKRVELHVLCDASELNIVQPCYSHIF